MIFPYASSDHKFRDHYNPWKRTEQHGYVTVQRKRSFSIIKSRCQIDNWVCVCRNEQTSYHNDFCYFFVIFLLLMSFNLSVDKENVHFFHRTTPIHGLSINQNCTVKEIFMEAPKNNSCYVTHSRLKTRQKCIEEVIR